MAGETAIETRELVVERGGRRVLSHVSLRAPAGSVTCILGPNGAGKSTLLRAIVQLLPYRGSVLIGGVDASRLDAEERARLMAYVPQRSLLDAPLEVERVVAQGRYAHRRTSEDARAVEQAMRRTDVLALARRRFDRLSTGEQRRVLVARALATGASFVLLDEPTAALDVRHALELHGLLRILAADGYAIVVVLHGLDDARRFTDRALLLHDGVVVADGPSSEVIDRERVRAVYGVEMRERDALGLHLPESA